MDKEAAKNGKRRGLVLVYTGDGKGKTTAALGLGVRAVGHGSRVLMIQFMKGSPSYGEVKATGLLPDFKVIQFGLETFVNKAHPSKTDIDEAQAGWARAKKALEDKECDLLILDEANVAVDYGLISLAQLLELIDLKPAEMDLVITGRGAHPEVIARADLVSEVREIKHHYRAGVKAREGIEF
ncbi:MAG: cob(I)yrinic acid a,c-diamide adenosyltransferase [Syntrophothermus sp.]